jgi:iron complex outermembrane recepter protein
MNTRLALTITSLIAATLAAGSASAQRAAADAASAPAAGGVSEEGLQEIVVTAQRREESSQKAAISISTLSGDTIKSANVSRPGDLTSLVPALQVTDETGPYSGFYVRGVGNFAANALSDPALTFNFDGVTVGRAGTSGFFYDLERVEVLKGPQGTLYGRNATGGAINVISKEPVLDTYGVDAAVQFGNYSSSREDVMLNAPIGGTAAVRVAAYHAQHNGFMSDGTDDQGDTGARLSFLLKPSDMFNVRLTADYFKQAAYGAGSTITATNTAFVPPVTFSAGSRYGLFSPEVGQFLGTQPDFLNGTNFVPYEKQGNQDNRYWGVQAILNWRTSIGTVTFIPAYRSTELDYTSFAVGVMLREVNSDKQTSFELRLASDNDSRFQYVVGAFYLSDPDSIPRFDINQQSVATFESYTTDTTSRALFASLTYTIVPTVKVTGGVRYTKDDKDFFGTLYANSIICTVQTPFGPSCPNAGVLPYTQMGPIPPSFFNPDGTITTLTNINNASGASYSKTTWRAGIDWDISDRNLLYASVDTGYKAGGFFFWSDNNVYKPENITAYSLGSKNRFFDNRLQVNADAFYWRYKDQQISHLGIDSQGIVGFPTENVGQATYKGIEVDVQARPWLNTLLTADVQYENGVYDSFVYHTPNLNGGVSNGTGCANGAPPGQTYTVDCSGQTPPYTPRWTATASAQQTIPLPGGGGLVGLARVHYQSETLTALDFLPVSYQPGYSLWDFDLTYHTAKDRYFVGAYVNNAFDKTATNFSFAVPFSGFTAGLLQNPRTYGLRAGLHF